MANNQEMNWAAVAAKGAHQSPAEARPPPVNTIVPNESLSTSNLVDVDSGVTVVPPDFLDQEVKTETQATRLKLEAEAEAAAAGERERPQNQSSQNQNLHKPPHEKRQAAKKQVRKAEYYAVHNPVTLVNSILGGVAAVVLGVGAWRKYKIGELSWKVVGVWGGVAAAVVAVDVVVSRFYLKRHGGH